jgi:hypothetical protein
MKKRIIIAIAAFAALTACTPSEASQVLNLVTVDQSAPEAPVAPVLEAGLESCEAGFCTPSEPGTSYNNNVECVEAGGVMYGDNCIVGEAGLP